MLGLSPSTYDYYEASRVPPAQVLVKIAEVADVDLCWLLTGETEEDRAETVLHPAVRRAGELIKHRPDAAEPLSAFLDVLERSLELGSTGPTPGGVAGTDCPSGRCPDADARDRAVDEPDAHEAQQARWIPVLGRSAAGVPEYWEDPAARREVTNLEDIVAEHVSRTRAEAQSDASCGLDGPVEIIHLPDPQEGRPAEFIAAAPLKRRYPDAFALRIDGESMAPHLRHDDLVITSPSAAVEDGKPAIVQLDRQIGVTCKLLRREGDRVHLVPLNDEFEPMTVPAERVRWAYRALACIRDARSGA